VFAFGAGKLPNIGPWHGADSATRPPLSPTSTFIVAQHLSLLV